MTPGDCAVSNALCIDDDAWLTALFGHAAWRVAIDPMAWRADTTSKLTEHVTQQTDAFYFTKLGTRHVSLLRALSQLGFVVVDVNVTYEASPVVVPVESTISVRDSTAADSERLLEIAESAFEYSRFHLDELIGQAVANRSKRLWVESYLQRQRGDRLFVCHGETGPSGFLAALIQSDTAVIDLIATAPQARQQGAAMALLGHFARHYHERGFTRLRVGTQVANVPSVRLYEKAGYRLRESQYVMHLHVRAGRVVR
jgi:ribosomal protein S18 acetylase RimI-like enzyme